MLDIDNLMPPTKEDASNSRKPCFDGLNVGDHMCSFHRTKKEYIDAVSKFIIEGIENKQKTIFLNPPQFQDEIWKDLESLGYSIDTFTSNKQVEIYLQHETYLKDGYFNPQHVHQFLAEKVHNAISEGFSATRIAGMGSQVTTHTDEKTWVDYERSVRYSDLKLFRCMAVCHYFIDNLTGSLLNAILEAHPLCQIGNDILMNSNYLPVDIQDEADPQRAEFEFRIQQMYNQKHREEVIYGLYEKTQKLTEFSHILGHELKAPIRSASVLGDLLAPNNADEKIYRELKKCLKTAYDRLESIETLSALEKPSCNHMKLNLNTVLQGILEDKRNEFILHNISVQLDVNQAHQIMADRTHIHQIILNIIDNAIKYRKPDTPLELNISIREGENEETLLSIQDNGRGIDKRFHKKMFMPFVRLNENQEELPGKGMGLSICNRIMEVYGGRIEVESEEGQGSTFTLVFPKIMLT